MNHIHQNNDKLVEKNVNLSAKTSSVKPEIKHQDGNQSSHQRLTPSANFAKTERNKDVLSTRQDRLKKPSRKSNERRHRRPGLENEFEEKVVEVKRVTNVRKGGRIFRFSVYVVIGNKKGQVGIGHGKASEVPDAIKKAVIDAKKRLVTVPLVDGRTIPHEQKAKFLASRIIIKPASKGKGLISGGAVRPLVQLLGCQDIITKTFGSRTKVNVMKAALKALTSLRTWDQIKTLRGIGQGDKSRLKKNPKDSINLPDSKKTSMNEVEKPDKTLHLEKENQRKGKNEIRES